MKIFAIAFLSLFTALLYSQCKHQKFSAPELPGAQLRFGHGGGFTGVETTFILLDNGQLFKFASKAPQPLEIAGARRKIAGKLFDTAQSLGLLQLDFMHPGNTYTFIEFQNNGQQRRIAWGDQEHPVDPNIKALYDQLTQLVAENK